MALVATSSAEIRWVAYDDDYLEDPPSFHEWVDASCGSITREEQKTENELSVRQTFGGQPLTKLEGMLRDALSAKINGRSACQTILASARRNALPAQYAVRVLREVRTPNTQSLTPGMSAQFFTPKS
jgi:hypothetical protein